MPIQKVITALGLLAATLAGSATQTQENQAAQERVMAVATQYADAQTVAIGYVDLGEEWIDLWEAMFTEAASGERTTEMDAQTASAREMLKHLRSAGARELVILMSLSDAHAEGGPLVVITREEIPDASVKLAGLIEMGPKQGPWRVAVDIRREMLLVGMPAVVERYKKLQSVPRPDLLGPLEKLLEPSTEGKPTAGLVLSPGSDARRVVREL